MCEKVLLLLTLSICFQENKDFDFFFTLILLHESQFLNWFKKCLLSIVCLIHSTNGVFISLLNDYLIKLK